MFSINTVWQIAKHYIEARYHSIKSIFPKLFLLFGALLRISLNFFYFSNCIIVGFDF